MDGGGFEVVLGTYKTMYWTMQISKLIRRNALTCILLLIFPTPCVGMEGEAQGIDVQLHVEVVSENERQIPKFSLVIENVSAIAESILDLRKRPDLHGSYADLQLSAVNQYVELEYFESNPGEIRASDFMALQPYEKIMFEIIPTVDVNALPPGKYRASVQYWADPIKPVIYNTPAVVFVITK